MCRITAFIDYSRNINYDADKVITEMRDSMMVGGPDDEGNYIDKTNEYTLGFGHRRLSIIDVSMAGHQPMFSEDGNVVIIYNGEMYNYEDVRSELSAKGVNFKSGSDTEVIIKAYETWGIGSIEKFIGMFALILYDKRKQFVYVLRDRAGVKPMYYYNKGDVMLFGSELKSFHKHPSFIKEINPQAVALFLQSSYIPAPHSIFKNAYKVKPGHYLCINLRSRSIEDICYWDAIEKYNQPMLTNVSLPEILSETEALLTSACNYRMVADVPVGVFLSGGYDSSLVTALLQKDRTEKIKTFSIGFHEEEFNEANFAKQVANHLGTDHTEYYCTREDALEIIPLLPHIYDEPFGDSSAIPTTLVSKIARKDVKVALSADAGDELFGGYEKYSKVLGLNKNLQKIPSIIRRGSSKVMDVINPGRITPGISGNTLTRRHLKLAKILKVKNTAEMMHWYGIIYTPGQLDDLLHNASGQKNSGFPLNGELASLDAVNAMLAYDYVSYLPGDILTKVDRATMSVSLEGREPLLDHRLLEFMARVPGEMKIHNGIKKFLLKEILHQYVPPSIMDRKKMGFGVPITLWFKDALKKYFDHYLSDEALNEHKIFNLKTIQKKKKAYFSGDDYMAPELWNLLMFQMWYSTWMK